MHRKSAYFGALYECLNLISSLLDVVTLTAMVQGQQLVPALGVPHIDPGIV